MRESPKRPTFTLQLKHGALYDVLLSGTVIERVQYDAFQRQFFTQRRGRPRAPVCALEQTERVALSVCHRDQRTFWYDRDACESAA